MRRYWSFKDPFSCLIGICLRPGTKRVQHICQLYFSFYVLHNLNFLFQPSSDKQWSLLHIRDADIVGIWTPRVLEEDRMRHWWGREVWCLEVNMPLDCWVSDLCFCTAFQHQTVNAIWDHTSCIVSLSHSLRAVYPGMMLSSSSYAKGLFSRDSRLIFSVSKAVLNSAWYQTIFCFLKLHLKCICSS